MTTPQRRLDAAALKGLAHPLRVDILDSLAMAGPATASLLADRLGESSGATSYHLRQLARHGFVEEDPDRGTGRERWWRMVPGGLTLAATDMREDRAAMDSTILVARQFADQRARHVDTFLRRGEAELGPAWVDSSMLISASVRMTAHELDELTDAVEAFVSERLTPFRDREEPPEAKVVALHVNAFPVVGVDGDGS
ncbi:ArsR/SmtB family transcription factor [Demequina muriae]|uniref:Winged helix-turn-helix domain-containing protein n=1 Tax=Demequina muriae TaxID=3051664 RepID=A0ABT8GEA6_9MICO|nr:winged helix-turn-helix domain-containing protein [Demequina sp. EGI L300058]MDN4479616.1 winged helix-turn-helix domain-containing protein [Demequina sp. EGI L300058]